MSHRPDDNNQAYRFPVSVKGVVVRSGRVVLLKNEREEWELPGGKLEPGETPDMCVSREIEEELQLRVAASRLLDSWIYVITEQVQVLIVTYGCSELEERDAVLSDEHKQLQWFPLADVASLTMPAGYKTSIRTWVSILRGSDVGARTRAAQPNGKRQPAGPRAERRRQPVGER